MLTLNQCRKNVNQHLGVKTKKEAIALLKHKIATDNRWLYRSILAIYNKQTSGEKRAMETIIHNNVGFTAFDATRMSKIALFILREVPLSPRQVLLSRLVMKKYCEQLYTIALDIVNRKGE